jgi:carbonic anhydrase
MIIVESLQVMLITCIDSRCNPTMLFGLEAGEAFVVRNVANFVHPYEGQVHVYPSFLFRLIYGLC